MPIIRQHVYTFVQVYNTHWIRRQKNREEYLLTSMLLFYIYITLSLCKSLYSCRVLLRAFK